MPKADDHDTTSPEPTGDRVDAQQPETDEAADAVSQWPLGDLETELHGLRTVASLLGHVAHSPHEIGDEDLSYMEHQIIAHHDRLKALWKQVWDERAREEQAHAAELAAVKKARAVPGSPADKERVEAWWCMLAAAASSALAAAHEAMPPAESEGRAPA